MEVSDGSHGCSTLRACKFDDGIRTASRTSSLPNNYDLSALFYVPSDVLFESTPPSDLSVFRQYYFRSSSLVCVWIVCGLALVTCSDGALSGPVDVVPVSVLTNLIMARRA